MQQKQKRFMPAWYKTALEAVKAGHDLADEKVYLCPICGHIAFGKPPFRCPICSMFGKQYLRNCPLIPWNAFFLRRRFTSGPLSEITNALQKLKGEPKSMAQPEQGASDGHRF